MRQASILAIVKSTALEILSEPLTLLVSLASLVMTVLAPAFHYHQFGDPTRMARDAGFSAMITCGCIVAVFCTIRTFRREIESGTMAMALVHPISRQLFVFSKIMGAFLAYLLFIAITFAVEIVMFRGAEIGGLIAKGDVARIYGPCLLIGLSMIFLPILIAAALNRFARFRFVLSAMMVAFIMSVALIIGFSVWAPFITLRLFLVGVPIVVFALVMISAAAAFAVRFKANVAASAVGILLAACFPIIGNYYLVDVLSKAGILSIRYLLLSMVASLPALAMFLIMGAEFVNERDVQ